MKQEGRLKAARGGQGERGSVILDIPALVAENNGALGRKLGRRRGGHPDPLAAEEFLLAIELPS